MKINRQKLNPRIGEIIAYGVACGEEIDVTTKKVIDAVEQLIIAVEILDPKQYARKDVFDDLITESYDPHGWKTFEQYRDYWYTQTGLPLPKPPPPNQ